MAWEDCDLSALGSLTRLQTLHLEGNAISDLSPLSNLKDLRVLWLWHGSLESLRDRTERRHS